MFTSNESDMEERERERERQRNVFSNQGDLLNLDVQFRGHNDRSKRGNRACHEQVTQRAMQVSAACVALGAHLRQGSVQVPALPSIKFLLVSSFNHLCDFAKYQMYAMAPS